MIEPTDIIGDCTLYRGDCLAVLPTLTSRSVKCCITSPPYWGGLRDYGTESQLGIETAPEEYVDRLSTIMLEVNRVVSDDGTLWLNIGDTFAASGKGGGGSAGKRSCWDTVKMRKGFRSPPPGFKFKDLSLTPFMVADRLRRDGWYLRQTVIWSKPSAVEPLRLDRPASSHEYLFLFSKNEQYAARDPGESWWGYSVWHITPARDPIHPAMMPSELVRRCLRSSTSEGDTILDPFAGAATVGQVSSRWRRKFIGIELDPNHYATAHKRLTHATGCGPGQLFSALEAV